MADTRKLGELPQGLERIAKRFGLRSLRVRILGIFIAALLALFSAIAFLVWQEQQTASSLEMITRGYLPLSKSIARLDRDRQRVANDLKRLQLDERRPGTGAESPTVIYTEAFARNLEAGRAFAAHARRLARTGEERAVLNKVDVHLGRIDDLARQYEERSRSFLDMAEVGPSPDGTRVFNEIRQIGEDLGTEVQQLARLVDGRISGLTEATQDAQFRGLTVAAFLSAVALGFSILLFGAIVVALRPISWLTREVARLGAGQTTGHVPVQGADEIAALALEFNNMVDAIRQRDARLTERAEELRLLSRYLSSVLDGLEEGLIVVEQGTVTLANPAAERAWGIGRGQALPDLFSGLSIGRHEVGVRDTLHELRIAPFGDDGSLWVTTDITEQTATRQRLARSERLALVGQMLAQITHEVRNPLNALSLNAELMADELQHLDPERRTEAWELLATISGEIERLTQVTAHYLQLARRPPAVLAFTDIRSLIDDVARLLRPEFDQAGVALRIHDSPACAAAADGNQVRQAVLNVLRNARESGARDVHVSVDASAGEVILRIRDDGPGMTTEDIERAFDPFWSGKESGTGLGLAITKQILEAHGGEVRLRAHPGEGTTVEMVLPGARRLTEDVDEPEDPSRR